MFNMTNEHTERYQVRRTLSYAPTLYGSTDDLAEAVRIAKSRTVLGYPSCVFDTLEGVEVWRRP